MPEAVVIETPKIEIPQFVPPKPAEAEISAVEIPAESDTAASPGEEKPATETPPEKPDAEKKSSSRFERKISRLHREAAEQKARADLLEQQLKESQPKTQDDSAPRLEQFDDVEKYAEAVAKHRETKVVKEIEAKQRIQAQQAAQTRLQSDWDAKVIRAESKYEDFDEVVGELKPITPWAVAIMRSENGEDVAHHLGTNLNEAQRIMALDPVGQFIEIGRLSAKLQAEPAKPKEPSGAPAPIKPVGGSSAPTAKKLSDMSYDEFEKKRKAQIAARR